MGVGQPSGSRSGRRRDSLRPGRSGAGALLSALFPAMLVVAIGLGSAPRRAHGYLLYDNGALDYIIGAEDAIRWAPDIWGPGATLDWRIEDSPAWTTLFGSTDNFAAAVSDALSRWADIPTADIRWRLAGTAETPATAVVRDSSNRVFLTRSYGERAGAGLWFARDRARHAWDIVECDIRAPQSWLFWEEDGSTEAERLGRATDELVSSLRDCLGLAPPAGFPASRQLRASESDSDDATERNLHFWASPEYDSAVWKEAPMPTRDDSIGASLLRPKQDWLAGVGGIAGSLRSGGEPVRYAHVWALPWDEAGIGDPVGAFSDRSGAFLIEGLAPGAYLLWVHPIDSGRQERLAAAGATMDIRDAVLATPVRVEAGRVSGGIAIPLQGGRSRRR